jgi:tetratricopeptide (TPR) repeat protein
MGLRVGIRKSDAALILRVGIALASLSLPFSGKLGAQGSRPTVRHHRVEDTDPIAAKLTQAEDAIAKQDYATAEPLLKQVVAERPADYAAWYDLGFLYHAQGRNDESIEAYKKSVQAKPTVFESNLNLGLELASAGKPEAEQYLRAATKLTPTSHPVAGRKRAWIALGHVLESSNPEEAVSAFRQAAVADPKDPEPHLLAGSALEQLKNPEAEQEYQLALSVDPKSTDALTALTNFYMAQHRFSDAEALLRKLVVVHPNDPAVHMQLGRMLAIAGKNDDAIAEMQAGLKLDPSDTKAQRDLADLFVTTHKYADAEQIYMSLLKQSPNDAGLHHLLGRAIMQQKKFGDAEKELARAIQLKPDSGEAYGDLAIAANGNKDYPLVIKCLDARAKYLPENPLSYFLRATAYDHLRDVKQASRYYHEFLNVSGGKFPEQEWQAKHRLIAIEK